MDAKLKALKVVDLRNILSTANVSVPTKAPKNELIARIQASKPALDAYAALYPADDLLAPPEEVDWNVEQPEPVAEPVAPPPAPKPKPTSSTAPKSAPAPPPAAPAPVPVTATTNTDPNPSETDPEVEKRRQRAARFGIPLVEPKQQKKPADSKTVAVSAKAVPGVEPKKLEERAARFGIKPVQPAAAAAPATNSKKRSAPPAEELDPEELERRKKRAERFGIPIKA
ncbi:hypothetical protein BDZ97DRAFT_1778568 [Flammula alnicola]|nr:hypothetical protein BDZ97DRAFT_1778568 [Flammula alnicola]